MISLESEILIHRSISTCFDAARNLKLHTQVQRHTKERIIECPPSGMLELGDTVTFEARHFGIKQRLTSKIIVFEPPHLFVDQMQRGAFAFLRHTHMFLEVEGGTLMRDKLELAAPLGPIGWIAERVFLRSYMHRFIVHHQHELRRILEKDPLDR